MQRVGDEDNPYAPPRPGEQPPVRPPAGPPLPGHGPGPGPGHRPPQPAPPRPEPPPPTSEQLATASRRIQHFAALGLASLVTLTLPLPWQLTSPALALVAAVLGVRALVAARRARLRGGVLAAIGGGLGLAFALVLMFGSVVALWPLQLELQQCQRDALTVSAQSACLTEFERGVAARLGGLTPSG